jgi:ABC-type oligopeptide transport system ATPase subunit
MQRGRIVESGPAKNILSSPTHDATRSLLAATPRLFESSRELVNF